jgi:hypothetical protein
MNKAVVADRGQSPLAVNDLGLNFPLTAPKEEERNMKHETWNMKLSPSHFSLTSSAVALAKADPLTSLSLSHLPAWVIGD